MLTMQDHFLEGAVLSAYNKAAQGRLHSESERPEHDMRDAEALKDACAFLLIVSGACPGQREAAGRLLFNLVSSHPSALVRGALPWRGGVVQGCCYFFQCQAGLTQQSHTRPE